ncbi:MAG: ABC transporter ATP-binding protein [Proteobacteria bacterium]|nr:ABC transporter ATP-binding protein [Pseudomonadota bacterium]
MATATIDNLGLRRSPGGGDGTPPGGDPRLIDIDGVEKVYISRNGEQVRALADASFSIREGEFISVVGPSGCGKTTLLRIVAGLTPRTRGDVSLAGTIVNGPSRDIGIVFQAPVLLPWRTTMNLDLQRIWAESGKTVLLITHSIPEAVFLGDRVVVMTSRPGRIDRIIDVGIPRPRSMDCMSTPRFGDVAREIRQVFESKGQLN